MSQPVFGVPGLERCQSIAMNRCVGIDGIGVERLANEKAGLPMIVATRSNERDVRGERDVSRDFLPNEVKRIVGEPHVVAAACDSVGLFNLVVFCIAGFFSGAGIQMPIENAERAGVTLTMGHVGKKESDGAQGEDGPWTEVHADD